MSKTHRSSGPLLPGYHHSGDRGLGRRGGDIPATGLHGPAIPYPGLSLPADAEAEIMISILTVPGSLTFFAVTELGEVQAEGTTGVGTYRLWADGVDRGTSTYTVNFGTASDISGTAVGDGPVLSGGLGVNPASVLGGTAVGDEPVLGGGIDGSSQWERALNIYTLLAPVDQVDNLGGFAPKDPAAVVTLAFEFKRFTPAPQTATLTIEWHRGAPDPAPEAVLLGSWAILGTKVLQRVHGGVDEADYTLRVDVTDADGSVYPMVGILPVRTARP